MTPDLAFRDPYSLDFLELKDRYLEKDLEDPPIGLILYAGTRQETVELLELDRSRIRVAT